MADKQDKSDAQSFDLDRIKQLIRMMEKHDLREVKLEGGDQKWVLKRGAQDPTIVHSGGYVPPPPMAAPPASAAAMAPAEGASSARETGSSDGLVEITSPTVGTFYQSAQPGDPPFVKVGDKVRTDTIVCIVEAMKVFNQIPAEVNGTIAKVLVQDGDAVEFGQPLFAVTPG
jgi:acetyl-CoA carboxylase biotin carboxyl carrier protein